MACMAWTIEIMHVPTQTRFHGQINYFENEEDSIDSDDVSTVLLAERNRFIDCQKDAKCFMFDTPAGYCVIPPDIVKDCCFFSFVCDKFHNPVNKH